MSLQLTGSSSPVSLGWGCEFPRLLHPFRLLPASCSSSFPASQALRLSSLQDLQVAPNPRFNNRLSMRPRVAPIFASSDSPTVNLRVAPDLRSVCAAFRPTSEFPRSLPSGSTGGPIFGSPRISPLRRCRKCVSGFPRLLHLRLVDDEPDRTRTLHLSAWPRDESSRPIGRSHIPPALDAFPSSLRLSTCRTSQLVKRRSKTEPASSCRNRTAFPIPYRLIN